jgi:platelet-activating factor acetylhydrolase isoform II
MTLDYESRPPQWRKIPVRRRHLLAGMAMFALGLPAAAGPLDIDRPAVPDNQGQPARLTVPAPTGPYAIGRTSLRLVDYARQDPYWTTPHARELMVSVWYPTREEGGRNLVPWMPARSLVRFRGELADLFATLLSPPDAPPPPGSPAPNPTAVAAEPISLNGVRFPVSHAVWDAPVGALEHDQAGESAAHRYPVVLYSPGYGLNREQGTALVEDLASHGYVVITISHTYESAEVEFPVGRVEYGRHDLDTLPHVAVAVRREDTRFVLDKLHEIAAGVNFDSEQHPVPRGLGRHMDLTKIGMFGHSLGGATVVQTMVHDQRVIAGIDLDGTVFPDIDPLLSPLDQLEAAMRQLALGVSDRPLMFMTSGGAFGMSPQMFFGPFVGSFWDNLPGWRRFLSLSGAGHFHFTDNELLLKQCIAQGIVTSPDDRHLIEPDRAVAVERAYIRAFFDLWLRNRDRHLLNGPSVQFPEIVFY